MKTWHVMVGAVAPLFLVACIDAGAADSGPARSAVIPIALADGHVRGDIGAHRHFDDAATLAEGATNGVTLSYAKVQADARAGTGMIILNLDGGTFDDFRDGDTPFPSQDVNARITVLGCSGPAASNIDYDQPAQHGVIHVAARPDGTRAVTITGTWTQDADGRPLATDAIAEASFVYGT